MSQKMFDRKFGKICSLSCSALFTIALSGVASADDTEVFFGYKDPDASVFPNVMLVLDSSAAMNQVDPPIKDKRITRIKEALQIVLDNATNVNVGLMEYPGNSVATPVMYPITYIDERQCEGSGCGSIELRYPVNQSDQDGYEATSGSTGTNLSSSTLVLGPVGPGSENEAAFRFTNVQIPTKATVVSAHIEFVPAAEQSSALPATMTFEVEKSDDSMEFLSLPDDLIDRDRVTTSTAITMDPGPWLQQRDGGGALVFDPHTGDAVFDTVQSADLSEAVQKVVNGSDWCGGQALTVFARSSDERKIRSIDVSSEYAPQLVVNYDASSIPASGGCMLKNVVARVSSSPDDAEEVISKGSVDLDDDFLALGSDGKAQSVGIRFNNIDIPPGSEIRSAYLEFTGDDYSGSFWSPDRYSLSTRIFGEDEGDTVHFKKSKRNVTNRTDTSKSVDWIDMLKAFDDMKLQSPDISEIVQEIVDRGDWAAGNSMAFMINHLAGSGRRTVKSFDNSSVDAPMLYLQYRTVKTGSTAATTIVTAREEMKKAVTEYKSSRDAPIVETLADVVDYFRGEPIGADSISYPKPIQSSCQTNHVVMLTAGDPASASHRGRVESMLGGVSCASPPKNPEICGRELASWMSSGDIDPTIAGDQQINVHTVALEHKPFMKDVSRLGGGGYHLASTVEELVDVYTQILGEIMDIDTSFVAPAATVNQFNRLTHRSDIYFSLFRPMASPSWQGNLKKYNVSADANGEIIIKDVNGNAAVNMDTGFFAEDAKSFWSDLVDGKSVGLGGAAAEMTVSRNVYTNVSSDANVNLSDGNNDLHEDERGSVTKSMLDISGESDWYHYRLLRWARGVDVLDSDNDTETWDSREHMGDPMHSKPLIVTYPGNISTVFVTTNEGFLHAVDSSDGSERYSFIPRNLLPNLDKFYQNLSFEDHPYGLDGQLSLVILNGEGPIVDGGETAMLYFGMRRGGRNYYAMDVTSLNSPRLEWIIKGGVTTGFEQLGQSWSRMTPAKINIAGSVKDVLIFGGGYDTRQDSDATTSIVRTPDTVGKAVFIVDAETGKKLWTGTSAARTGDGDYEYFSDMKYSIPSDIKVVDTDFDGLADQMYVGDMGAQLWRFDINNHAGPGDPLVQGGLMADFGADAKMTDTRRFFYAPDVALMADQGQRFLSIAVGSGWRAHPLDTVVEDRFYMIRSDDVYSSGDITYGKLADPSDPTSDIPLTEADLVDITANADSSVNFSTHNGWMLKMTHGGEKVLSSSTTTNGQVIFTSYEPTRRSENCDTSIGGGRVYVLDMLTGRPKIDLNNDDKMTIEDRSRELKQGGISPEPTVLIAEEGDPIILVGPQQPLKEFNFGDLTVRTFWREEKFSDNEQ